MPRTWRRELGINSEHLTVRLYTYLCGVIQALNEEVKTGMPLSSLKNPQYPSLQYSTKMCNVSSLTFRQYKIHIKIWFSPKSGFFSGISPLFVFLYLGPTTASLNLHFWQIWTWTMKQKAYVLLCFITLGNGIDSF